MDNTDVFAQGQFGLFECLLYEGQDLFCVMVGSLSRQKASPGRSDKCLAWVGDYVSLKIDDAFMHVCVPIPTLLALPSMPITNFAASIIKEI